MPSNQQDAAAACTPDTNEGGFIHLHLHSEYSLLDGGNKIDRLLARVRQLGMSAVAVTDHGNLFGAVEFYNKAKAAGIKPILGIEAYVAPGDRRSRQPTGIADGGFHLVLLAENIHGWRNLLKLSSDSYVNGFYYKPRMDKSTLARHADGLIAINGHLGSSLAHHLTHFAGTGDPSHYHAAVAEAKWHKVTFGTNGDGQSRFFVELQRVGIEEQDRINPLLVKLASELDLPIVADNDAHFLTREDYDDHDTLCCISMGRTKDDATRLRYPPELYVKSPAQMAELFNDLPQAVSNSQAIADRCNVDLDYSASHAPLVRIRDLSSPPQYSAAANPTEWFKQFCSTIEIHPVSEQDVKVDPTAILNDCNSALTRLAEAGLRWRYGEEVSPSIKNRLARELAILASKNISAYFLIVWDFVNWARQRGIPAAARGSGVGTMVGYVLGLSNACPERFGLLFERFTDPDRSEYPDIDIDICQDGRADVLNYVRQKYGFVAQIVTFGRLKAKAAIKDVARVHGLSPAEGQRLSNLIPDQLNITIDAALQQEPNCKHEYESQKFSRAVFDAAKAIENHARHIGVHAAGVVIATQPLENIVPLCRATGSDEIVTQWDGPTCEKVGLLKMDFLGLRTLSTIELTRKLVRQTLPPQAIHASVFGNACAAAPFDPLDLDNVPFDDQRVFDVFRRGDTAGIFQFESGGMRKLLLEMQPDRLEDLIAANALFRPGPMELIPDYCKRKHRKQPVPKVHTIVDRFTAETYGIMVYQEQVMQIVHGLGDISLRDAYSLIKAISKKKSSIIDAERPRFLKGAQEKGLSRHQADVIFDLILKFAGYGFNKSHSTGYAIIAYHTAYLKTYFPAQYMAALLTYESAAGKADHWAPLLDDARRIVFPDHSPANPHMGVEVKPPDINLSEAGFAVVFQPDEPRDNLHGHVRFGLNAIKGVGTSVVEAIITQRAAAGPFTSLDDFCERVAANNVNRGVIEAFIKSGSLDSLHGASARAAMCAHIESAIAAGQASVRDRLAGQMNLFAGPASRTPSTAPIVARVVPTLPSTPPWSLQTMLAGEKESLGFRISGHPLDQYLRVLQTFCTTNTKTARSLQHDSPVIIGGVLSSVRTTVVKNGRSAGERMAMVTLQDRDSTIDGVVFSSVFAKISQSLLAESVVLAIGRVDRNRGEPQIIIDQVLPIDDAPAYLTARMDVNVAVVDDAAAAESTLQMLLGLLQQAGPTGTGNGSRQADVRLNLFIHGQRYSLRPLRLRCVPSATLLKAIDDLLGVGAVQFVSTGIPQRAEPARRTERRPIAPTVGVGDH